MATSQVLAELGVTQRTLSEAEKAALDERGFVVLRGVLDRAALERMRASFEALAAQDARGGTRDERGTRHVDDLPWRDAAFDLAFTHPRLLAAAWHVLRRPFRLLLLSGRDPLPGFGLQGLHADWIPRAPHEPFSVVTALWLLDGFTAQNGATRVVSGSHRVPGGVPKSLAVPAARHPEQELVRAEAGDALVFNGHLWHSGTRNGSTASRRVLQCQLVARDLPRPTAGPREAPARLSPAAASLLAP